jgi:uncharacterized oxidoreductase
MGERQATDANAMPLDDFIKEVMNILTNHPEAPEVLVAQATPLREASYQGASHYQDLFKQRNDLFLSLRKKEWEEL